MLAQASGRPESGLGGGRLVWLVVARVQPLIEPVECDQPIGNGVACGWAHPAHASGTVVVVVDAVTGDVITTVQVRPEG